MVNKEFKINKTTKKIINYDGKEISVDEFNKLYYGRSGTYPALVKFEKFFEEIYYDEEKLKEFKKLHRNLESDIESRWANFSSSFGNFTDLWESDFDDEDKIKNLEENLKKYDKKVKEVEYLVAHMELLIKQKDKKDNQEQNEENDPDKQHEDKKKQANELRKQIDEAVEEIKRVFKQEPQILDNDLESENQEWLSLIGYALSKKDVDDIKAKVLADISAKRGIKQGKRKREDNEENDKTNDNSNKKPRTDDYNNLKNTILDEVEDNELKNGLTEAVRLEGEAEYSDEKQRKEIEEELIKRNPELYRKTIIDALQERINDNKGISMSELSEETKQLMRGEITDIDKFKEAKDRAIKEIGEVGAKSRWNSLFNRAKALLAKAKEKATEKVKNDIKEIQKQMNSLKSDTNVYLTSFYQNEKAKVEKWEQDLSSCLNTQTNPSKETPWGVIIPVSLVVVALIGVAAIVIIRRRKQDKIKSN